MCVVSAVIDNARHIPMEDLFKPFHPGLPQTAPAVDLSEVLKKLDSIDQKLGQKDCSSDDKKEWRAKFEKRMAELEKQIAALKDHDVHIRY